MNNLVGKSYTFEDGGKIEVIQTKQRDDGLWVHYRISMNDSLPRKLLMRADEFIKTYGHLFGVDNGL
jgi:hypothetical protein